MNIRNLALTGAALGVVAASAAAQGPWTTFPSPDPIVYNSLLYGVGGSGPNDVWAMGLYTDPAIGDQTLVLHWDGAQWAQMQTPAPFVDYMITAVAALAPDNVWAVGGHGTPKLFHFDGAAWSTSYLPNPGQFGFSVEASDLVALAPDNIWAVGWYDITGTAWLRTAVWHWNGTSWAVIPSPNMPDGFGGSYPSTLLSISAAGPNAIFAVGEGRIGATFFPLAMRFDGASWQLQNTPVSAAGDGRLRAVSAASANDVWAVGTANDHTTSIGGGWKQSFALHYDGSAWSVVPTPQPSTFGANPLRSVLAHGGQVYAVGCWETAAQGLDTFILQLDESAGTGFTIVPSTIITGDGTGWNQLYDIALIGNELWTVGFGSPTFFSATSTLVERTALVPQTTSFCSGDGSAGACPCGNVGVSGRGCENSTGTGGALLTVSGVASLSADTLQLTASSELPSALSIVLQGSTAIPAVNFGDGLRCAGGNLKRLYTKSASGGVITAPQPGDPSISARSGALGDPLPLGAMRAYQVYYRDANTGFCPAPPGSTFNATNVIAIPWGA